MNNYVKAMLYIYANMVGSTRQKRQRYKNEKVSCPTCGIVFTREMFSNRVCCSSECYKKLEIKQKDRDKIKRWGKKK